MSKEKKEKLYQLSQYEFNQENPFIKQAIEQVQQNVVKKYKTASNTDQRAILQAYDPNSGEVLGQTQFIRRVEVDEEQFAKLYLSNFSAFFNLKPPAIKVFGYILNQLKPNQDEFLFILDECLTYTGYKGKASVFQGLGQLVENEIIARGKKDFLYFINPMIVFNGSRVVFAKEIVKREKNKKIENKKD